MKLSQDDIPNQLLAFAQTFEEFRARLDEFREYDDGSIHIKLCIKSLEDDLKVFCPQFHFTPETYLIYSIGPSVYKWSPVWLSYALHPILD